MSNIANSVPGRIRDMRVARGWSQEELAERAGTTFSTISKLERSTRKVSLDWVERMAKAFGVTALEILGTDQDDAPLQRVPLIGRIAAGNWREAVMDPIGYVAAVDVGPNTFALEADGDSMDKIVAPGGYVIVDPDDTELRDGRIYAVMNGGGDSTVKRFRSEPFRLEPCSTNPEHQPIALGQVPFTVLGRVIAAVSRL